MTVLLDAPTTKDTQVAGLLRLATAGSVDDGKSHPGRPPAARHQVGARRPARGGRARLARPRPGPGRPGAAHRRPALRARAGHHHRRRLPLLRHAAPALHPGRHPRARAVHAQHGHRRLHRRARGDPGRRAQRRGRADPPPHRRLRAAAGAAGGAGGEQDGPGRLRQGPCSARSRPTSPPTPPRWASSTTPRSRSRRCAATTSWSPRRMDWYEGPTLLEHLENVPVETDPATEPAGFPVQYVIRHAERRLPRLRRHHRLRRPAGRRRGRGAALGPALDRSPASTGWAAGRARPSRRSPSRVRLADDLDVARGDLIAPAGAAPTCAQDVMATVCHLAERPLRAGDRVLLQAHHAHGQGDRAGDLRDWTSPTRWPTIGPTPTSSTGTRRPGRAQPERQRHRPRRAAHRRADPARRLRRRPRTPARSC